MRGRAACQGPLRSRHLPPSQRRGKLPICPDEMVPLQIDRSLDKGGTHEVNGFTVSETHLDDAPPPGNGRGTLGDRSCLSAVRRGRPRFQKQLLDVHPCRRSVREADDRGAQRRRTRRNRLLASS
jgi:hypothetical protein